MNAKQIAVVGVLSFASFASHAAAPFFSGGRIYVGADVGQSTASGACDGVPGGISCSDTDTALRLTAGYQFNPYVGAELSYADFGKANASGIFRGFGVAADVKASGFQAYVVGTMPLNRGFGLVGRLGLASTDVKADGNAAGASESRSTTTTTIALGVGAKYGINDQFSVHLMYDYYGKVGDSNTTGTATLSAITAGLTYMF